MRISDLSSDVCSSDLWLFLFAVGGGITTVTGALFGGLLFAALPLVQSEAPELAGLVFAAIAVTALALGKQPNGMAGLLYAARSRGRVERAGAGGQDGETTERGPTRQAGW